MTARHTIATALAFLFLGSMARAGELSLPDTEVHLIRSSSNGIEYKIYVSVPHDYVTSKDSYPVLYLLDADYSFPIARAIVTHLSDRQRLEKLIVVGIAYGGADAYKLNRTRDYTPSHTLEGGYGPEYQRVSGGAPKFLRFLREELIPWMDRTYRTKRGDRGLVGHSYGGLFASWVLLTAPETFSRYILVSPSLWYDDRLMFAIEKQTRDRKPVREATERARVFCGVGSREHNEERSMVVDLRSFVNALRARGAAGPDIRHEVFDDETHDSVFPTALSRGIRFTFGGD